jgi:DNA-binding transcriptional MerR regulator
MTAMRTSPPDADADAPDLPIAEVAQRTGLSRDTLRYYEKAGLISSVGRSSGGQRRYARSDLDWLAFLLRLRATGMSIADMRRFAALRRAGDPSVADRIELLDRHRDQVQEQIAVLQGHLAALSTKVDHYRRLLGQQSRTDQP